MVKMIVTNYLFLKLDKIKSSADLIRDYDFKDLIPLY